MSFNKECPCYEGGVDCTLRYKNCHETCKRYREWRAEKDADNKAKRESIPHEYWGYILPKITERKKRKNEKNNL